MPTKRTKYDIVIVGSGPAGLGAAFHLIENRPDLKILVIEKKKSQAVDYVMTVNKTTPIQLDFLLIYGLKN